MIFQKHSDNWQSIVRWSRYWQS